MAAITTAQAKNSRSRSWLRRVERALLVFIFFNLYQEFSILKSIDYAAWRVFSMEPAAESL